MAYRLGSLGQTRKAFTILSFRTQGGIPAVRGLTLDREIQSTQRGVAVTEGNDIDGFCFFKVTSARIEAGFYPEGVSFQSPGSAAQPRHPGYKEQQNYPEGVAPRFGVTLSA